MVGDWCDEHLRQIDRNRELRIAAFRGDGTPRDSVPVWSVVHDGSVFVRSWYRRNKGWNEAAACSGRARINVGDGPVDVLVDDVGAADPTLRRNVDNAYRRKYGESPGGMTSDAAAATTLRLLPGASPRTSFSSVRVSRG